MRRHIRVIYEDTRYNCETEINGTEEDIRWYYVGRYFNFGDTDSHPADLMVRCVDVEFI